MGAQCNATMTQTATSTPPLSSQQQQQQQSQQPQQQQQPQLADFDRESLKKIPLKQVNLDDVRKSKVVDFYKGKNVLITGGTGFLGKVILWKLIDSCQNYNKIYLMLRSKNDSPAQKRLVQLLKGKPFCFKYDYVTLLKKIVAIESDMTADGLALNQSDRQLLIDDVNIVIHSAASVKFDAQLRENLRDNVYGTRSIVELADQMHHLEALVHVSTAYSNCHQRDIAEAILPLERDIDDACKAIEELPANLDEKQTAQFLESRPNTYTYTKAVAEHYVARKGNKLPIAIVRPSIVISAAEEPCPGWVDNVNGIAGLSCLAAVGILRTIDWNYYATSDMVPVDYVANCILCTAYQTHLNAQQVDNSNNNIKANNNNNNRNNQNNKLSVYNMTSGNQKSISWGKFFEYGREAASDAPTNKIVRPMIKSPKYDRANPISFTLTKIFSEIFFAYFVDTLLNLLGYKKIMIRITQKMHHGYAILKPFTINQWNFHSQNLLNLSESLSPSDRELFKFDMRDFDWRKHAVNTWLGSRHFLLKEELTDESYKKARLRQRTVTVVHYLGAGLLTFALVTLGYTCLRILGSSLMA